MYVKTKDEYLLSIVHLTYDWTHQYEDPLSRYGVSVGNTTLGQTFNPGIKERLGGCYWSHMFSLQQVLIQRYNRKPHLLY